ncbi:MAG TPA: hypothetical protein ENJ00_04275 [Phycisphaerales bacterium]|nr:hypothetical protein [Phycisphaerales bacterium]
MKKRFRPVILMLVLLSASGCYSKVIASRGIGADATDPRDIHDRKPIQRVTTVHKEKPKKSFWDSLIFW